MKQNKKRYIYFRLHQDGPTVTDRQLGNAIWKSMLSLFGEITVADARFFLNDFNEADGTGYLQCNAALTHQLIISAVLIDSIEKTKVSFEPKKTSGTIKSLLKS